MRAIDSLPGMYGVGCISIFLDSKNRRLGDFVAGTVVIHEGMDDVQQPLWDRGSSADKALRSDVAALITMPEFELIEAFLSRRLDLTLEVRRDTARRIAQRIGEKLSVATEVHGSDEDFLESVIHQYRNTSHFHR